MIKCVVGCVKCRDEWGIVDCSGDFARIVFVEPEVKFEYMGLFFFFLFIFSTFYMTPVCCVGYYSQLHEVLNS